MSDMYHFYGAAAENILNSDFFFFYQMYKKAIIKRDDDRLFFRWVAGKWEREMNYQEFRNKLMQPVPDLKETEEEIFDKVRKILGG